MHKRLLREGSTVELHLCTLISCYVGLTRRLCSLVDTNLA